MLFERLNKLQNTL